MKPRNKYEKRVAELNATLSEDIAVRDIEWVKKQDYGYKKREGSGDTSFYFTLVTQVAEYQVRRLYRGYKFSDKHYDHYFFVEIMREFSEDGCNALYFGKQKTMGCYFDCFLYGSDMKLRSSHRNYARNSITDLFDMSWGEHPQSKGKRVPCERFDPKELGRIIKNNPVAENLYKERSPLFAHLIYQTYNKQVCRAITIAKRHGFVFDTNTSIWFDMVRAMVRVGADFHNPVFVAPKDLQATHDMFVNRWRRKQEEERRAAAIEVKMEETDRKLMQEKRTNDAYIKRRKRFYDMVLTDGLIECRVLPDVPAFRAEAEEMHHCVYTNEYYKKPYSLIMSATISGSRVETVEVDLTSFKILQCFGKHDQFTMYHDRIKELVNSQMDTIKSYNRRRTRKMKIAV